MNPGSWLKYASEKLGKLPDSYLVFDIETTGLDLTIDIPGQIGWAVVENNKVVDSGSRTLNWLRGQPPEFHYWISDRIARTKNQFEYKKGVATGKVYGISVDRLRQGDIPEKVLREFHSLVNECKKNGFKFIAHNGLRLDQPMLDRILSEISEGGMRLKFKPDEYLDTLSIEKSVQLFPEISDEETWLDFCKRAYRLGGSSVKGSLDNHCSVKYDLAKKHNLDMNKAHEADFDCLLTHYLFQEYKELERN
jgi:DNA polymerase III epsilon subunit-like protein